MKHLLAILVIAGTTLFLTPLCLHGQQAGDPMLFLVHQDQVLPSKQKAYEKLTTELKELLQEQAVADMRYHASMTDELTYYYVQPIRGMADLEKSMFSRIEQEAARERLKEIFIQLDDCYHDHGNYVLKLDPELSHQPNGIQIVEQDLYFRTYYFYHYHAADQKGLQNALLAYKQLHGQHGSGLAFRVYQSYFGLVGSYFMVAIPSRDAAHFNEMMASFAGKAGDEEKKHMEAIHRYCSRIEVVHARIRPDLSYKP